ncbi:MAG: aminopeptidase [Lautropia sp.]
MPLPDPPEPRPPRLRRVVARATLLGVAVLLWGCQSAGEGLGYYWQSVAGHWALLRKAEPAAALIADPATDPALRGRLEVAQRIRRFAVDALDLPDNGSYRRYAALDRPFVIWNVVAAPELSLELEQWCFPVAGCVKYRGYYSEQAARDFAADLARRGHDVQVAGVPAYSTLGWFDDPLLSTFIRYPDAELARLLFHELAHQVVYAKGDTTFNESYATAVERLGVARWLEAHGDAAARDAWARYLSRRADFLALLERHRDTLRAIYAGPGTDEDKRRRKRETFEALRAGYRALRDGRWGGYRGYDRWFDQPLGNAHLGAIASYTRWVPAFEAIFAQQHGDFGRFHAEVARLAKMDVAERGALLQRQTELATMQQH